MCAHFYTLLPFNNKIIQRKKKEFHYNAESCFAVKTKTTTKKPKQQKITLASETNKGRHTHTHTHTRTHTLKKLEKRDSLRKTSASKRLLFHVFTFVNRPINRRTTAMLLADIKHKNFFMS